MEYRHAEVVWAARSLKNAAMYILNSRSSGTASGAESRDGRVHQDNRSTKETRMVKKNEIPDISQRPARFNAKVERFFSGCNPVSTSEIITALAAGTVIKVQDIHNDALPAIVLLATIGLREHQQQIVDDYVFLIQRMNELFEGLKNDEWSNADVWHPELFLVSLICMRGPQGEYTLNGVPEAGYMFEVYDLLVNASLEDLFPPEVKMKEIA